MGLKTDYRDALYEKKKIKLVDNGDGTVTPVDMTAYTQEGDKFKAIDINATNAEINKLQGTADITLPAAGWGGAAPYTQTVQVPGVLATDVPIIGLAIADGATAEEVKLQAKAWGCVDRAVTGDGTITFYCYNKLPAVDFTVQAKGVRTNG